MDEWRWVTVGELAAPVRNALVGGPFGSNLVSADYVESGVPVVRGQNMGGRWLDGDFAFVTEEKAEALAANLARPGDVVFTQRGTLGQVSLVPKGEFESYVVSQSQMKLTVNERVADPLFVYYSFSSAGLREHILATAIQTGVPHTNLGLLRSTPLLLPPLREQQAISRVLGALDDKFDLNRRMSEALEAMARALFRSWFVDFDPLRAKVEGRDPDLPAEIAALFPDRFEESELGEIPAGWGVGTIEDLAAISGGSTPSTSNPEFWEGGTHFWVTPKDLSTRLSLSLLESDRRISDAGLAQISSGLLAPGTVLFSSRAPIGYLAIAEVPLAINQGFIALKPAPGVSPYYLVLWCRQSSEEILSRANGSTFLEISKSNFRTLPALLPPLPVLAAFGSLATPLRDRLRTTECESRTLAALRDTLLPKLISGELRVKDVETLLETESP